MRVLRRTGWVALGCLPFAAAAWVLLGSQLLAVQKVSITGTGRVSVAQVRSLVDVAPGTPLARVDTGAVAARLRTLAPVASVSVSRRWPHELRISIVERVVVAAKREGTGFVLLDGGGVRVATATAVPRGVVVLVSSSPAATTAALEVLRSLPAALRARLGSLQAPSAEQVTLLLADHRQVLWGGATDNAVKAAAVAVLLRMPGTVFDVSAKGVATRR
jgi:cell division protein FtsQ